jgi:dimethylargininase
MRVFDFDRAILRRPGGSVIDGLRANDGPSPDYESVVAEHDAYAAALEAAGVRIEILPALEAYPDSVFVEDAALVFAEGAILLRPGAPARAGEAAMLKPVLARHFLEVVALSDGHADGGDILVTPRKVLIGLSARTDETGARNLARLLAAFDHASEIVVPPAGTLHLKTASSLLDEETVLTTRICSDAGLFAGLRHIVVPDGEEAAANALRINEVLLVGRRFKRTIDLLDRAGYPVVALDTDAIGLIDAGLSCMSLRWRLSS